MNHARLMLVDDSATSNKILMDILQKAGYDNITCARCADEALTMLGAMTEQGKQADLIITDMVMPGMSGLEMCAVLRETPEYMHIPVIMITATSSIRSLEAAFELGVVDYITKPFNARIVLSRIKSLLRFMEEQEKRQEKERLIELHNRKLVEDLEVARRLQYRMLPKKWKTDDVQIHGFSLPASFLGGDFYYWEPIGPEKYCVVLLDIMGHGAAASMMGMYIRSLLPELMRTSDDAQALGAGLNQILLEYNRTQDDSEYYATTFCAYLDMQAHTLDYISAGHPPAILKPANKAMKWLDKGCLPLGVVPFPEGAGEQVSFEDGSHLIAYTDGLAELFSSAGMQVEALPELLRVRKKGWGSHGGVLEPLLTQIEPLPREDDVTLVHVESLRRAVRP